METGVMVRNRPDTRRLEYRRPGRHRDDMEKEPTSTYWQTVGRKVQVERRRRGFRTQQQLADAADVDVKTVGRLERGQKVSQASLDAMALAVGLNPDSLEPGASTVASTDPREVWMGRTLDRYDEVFEEAGREAADAYLAGAIARRREEERRILPDQQGSREVS
jgi:transcriptional regulator with XRE-family HTH domain